MIVIQTPTGSLEIAVQISAQIPKGQVYLFHGYREADANLLTGRDNLDPYSGFPAFRSTACNILKKE